MLEAVQRFLTEEIFLCQLLKGAGYTVALTALSMPLAVGVGLILALMRGARHKLLAWPAACYIEVIRGTPLLMQIFVVYYSLPELGRWLHGLVQACWPAAAAVLGPGFLTWPNFAVAVLCLAGNYAAYQAEILRAGLEAVDRGQREAALSIGMSERQAFVLVVLPQAFRIVVPPIINDLIAMLKDSSLVYAIGISELLTVALRVGRGNFTVPRMLVVAAAIYLILSLACYALGRWVERALRVKHGQELALAPDHGH
jgi:His/Glu/Gln/Arg/opine family amino acid ABC transporter permease subunit